MDFEITPQKRRFQWVPFITTLIIVISASLVLVLMLPGLQDLVIFGLYSIPSHMLISPFAHEPILLHYAKFYSPFMISLAGTIGCCIAGLLDYWLLIPLVNHRYVRKKFEDKNVFRKSLRFFEKAPFLLLMGGALSPVPFYPLKFLAIAGGYPLWRYELALILGRAPRFFILAVIGYALQPATWLLVAIFLVMLVLPFYKQIARWLHAALPFGKPRKIPHLEPQDLMEEYDDTIQVSSRPNN